MLMLYKVFSEWKPDRGAQNTTKSVPYQIFTAIVVNAYIVLRSRYPCWLESRAQRRRAWFVFA